MFLRLVRFVRVKALKKMWGISVYIWLLTENIGKAPETHWFIMLNHCQYVICVYVSINVKIIIFLIGIALLG